MTCKYNVKWREDLGFFSICSKAMTPVNNKNPNMLKKYIYNRFNSYPPLSLYNCLKNKNTFQTQTIQTKGLKIGFYCILKCYQDKKILLLCKKPNTWYLHDCVLDSITNYVKSLNWSPMKPFLFSHLQVFCRSQYKWTNRENAQAWCAWCCVKLLHPSSDKQIFVQCILHIRITDPLSGTPWMAVQIGQQGKRGETERSNHFLLDEGGDKEGQ